MSQDNILNSVIRQVDSIPNPKLLPQSEKVLIFNRKERKVVSKKPLWGGSHEYYLVSTAEVATHRGLQITIEDYSTDRKLGLLVNYQASCNPGDEEQLVEGLCSDNPPGLNLNKRIERWVRNLTRDRASDFIDHFVAQLRWLERELRQQAEDIGLRLNVQIAPDRSYMYYLISTARVTQPLAERENLIVPIQDVTNDRSMGVSIAYTARLRDAKNREKAIQELGEYSSISEALDEKIQEWTHEFIGDQSAKFIDSYDGQFASLKVRLENNARSYLNLLLDTRIEAEGNPVEEIIFKTKDPSNIAQGTHTVLIRGIATGRDISVVITYQAGFALGDRQKVAQAFSSSKSLPSEINKRLETWVARFIDQRTADEFITHYTESVQDLKSFLLQRAMSETGLHLELGILLDKQDLLVSFKVGSAQDPAKLAVHVNGYDGELELRYHTELIVDEANIVNAVLRSQRRDELPINIFVEKKINEYLLAEVSLDQFCYELKSRVRDGLFEYLNQALIEYGRRAAFLSLESDDVSSVPQEIIEIRYNVECEVQGYSETIFVRNTVQMLPNPGNLAMFRKMVPERSIEGEEKTPLQTWVESKLEKIVKPKLLQSRYINVLTKFDAVSRAIKEEMQQSATEIGFSVKQLVSVPDLDHDELKRDFSIEITEEKYRTSDANVEVKLNTVVTAKIENFEIIEDYLSPDEDVKELMRNAIHTTIRDYLDTVDPERYYMRFYHPDIDPVTGIQELKSVKQELEEKIGKALTTTFGAKILNVASKQLNTDIIDRLKDLRGKIGRFEFEIHPSGGEAIKFFAEFQVRRVATDGWYLFQERIEDLQRLLQPLRQERDRLKDLYNKLIRSSDLDDELELRKTRDRIYKIEQDLSGVDVIRQSIENGIRDQLTRLGSHLSASLTPQEVEALKIEISKWARASVKWQYGLEVSVENLHRLPTLDEQRQAALRGKTQDAQYRLKQDEVDKILALSESETAQHKAQLQMLTADRQAKFNELNILRKKRAELIGKPDPESYREDLEHLDQQIKELVSEISLPSLESAAETLQAIAAQPTPDAGSFLNLLGQMGASPELGSSPTPPKLNSESTAESVINAEIVEDEKPSNDPSADG